MKNTSIITILCIVLIRPFIQYAYICMHYVMVAVIITFTLTIRTDTHQQFLQGHLASREQSYSYRGL